MCLEGLESLLIMPVQRVPRYKLLLESLIKYTTDDDPELPKLQQVCICNVAVCNSGHVET